MLIVIQAPPHRQPSAAQAKKKSQDNAAIYSVPKRAGRLELQRNVWGLSVINLLLRRFTFLWPRDCAFLPVRFYIEFICSRQETPSTYRAGLISYKTNEMNELFRYLHSPEARSFDAIIYDPQRTCFTATLHRHYKHEASPDFHFN